MSENGTVEPESEKHARRVARAAKRHQFLKRTFELPPNEQFADDFHCALRRKILLQGRLYVFEHHICFYANIFGIVTNVVIPITSVTSLSKTHHVGFPNSIEVRTDDAQRYFFTSFLSREDAFRLMQLTLARHRPEGHANDTLDDSSTTPLCPPVSPSSRTSHDTAATGGQDVLTSDSSPSAPAAAAAAAAAAIEADSAVDVGTCGWPLVHGPPPSCPTGDGKEAWTIILEEDLPFVSLRDLLQQFGQQSPVFSKWHDILGDTGVEHQPWVTQDGVPGLVRTVIFTSLVKAPGGFAPPTAACYQTQRAAIYDDGVFVLDVQQTMPQVPFGESFQVEARWSLRGMSDSEDDLGVHLVLAYRVKLLKRLAWPVPSQIRNGTFNQARSAATHFVGVLRSHFEPPPPPSASRSSESHTLHDSVQAAAISCISRLPPEWASAFGVGYLETANTRTHRTQKELLRSLWPEHKWARIALWAVFAVWLLLSVVTKPGSPSLEFAGAHSRNDEMATALRALATEVSSMRREVAPRIREPPTIWHVEH